VPLARRLPTLRALLVIVLLGAASIVVVAGWRTSTAKVGATTENQANRWSAGTIELEADTASLLLLNVSDIWPGHTVQDCVLVTYRGSVPDVDIRLFGQVQAGTGLDHYLVATIETGSGGSAGSCDGFRPVGRPIFSGRLDTLTSRGAFEEAPSILPHAGRGDRIALRITLDLVDDNASQGLSTDFALAVEARP